MNSPFLQIWNKHVDSSGEPPTISNEASNNYFGYFENKFGEQWVFVYDREKRIGKLRGGDVDWRKPLAVIDGKVQMTLNDEEVAWLQTCWNAATFGGVTKVSNGGRFFSHRVDVGGAG